MCVSANNAYCKSRGYSVVVDPVSPSVSSIAMTPRNHSNAGEGSRTGEHTDESSGDESSSYSPPDTTTSKSRKSGFSKTKRNHPHIITQHNYHDHANDPAAATICDSSSSENLPRAHSPARGGTTIPFPVKLYNMLFQVDEEGLSHVISWQPHGRCFVVHDPATFKQLLPNYFKLSKIASFQRQLNLYGFQRLTVGLDKSGYYNELFLRNRPDLVSQIQRVKVKGTGVRAKSNPKEEPNLSMYPAVDFVAASTSIEDPVVSSTFVLPETTNKDEQCSSAPLPLTLLSADIVPRALSNEDADPVTSTELKYVKQRNPTGILRNLSSLDFFEDVAATPPSYHFKDFLRNLSTISVMEEETERPKKLEEPMNEMLLDDMCDTTMTEAGGVSFDCIIDEMFGRDQTLDFSDLLRLAAF
jgi:hypothetical protein